MSNPLYREMNGNNNYINNNMLGRLQQFARSFNGDPQKQVQELLNSGRITQQQYNQAVQKARSIQKMLGM